MESHDVSTRRRCEGSRLVEDVGSLGNMSERREGADDEIGENHENLKAKVVSYMQVPMEVDYVSGSEPEEDWEDVDEVRRRLKCYKCGMMGYFARDSRGNDDGKGGDGSKGYAKGKGKAMKGAGKKRSGKSGGPSGDSLEIPRTVLDVRSTQVGRVSMEAGVEEEDADCPRRGGQLEPEEDGEVGRAWIVGNVVHLEEEGEGTGRLGCRATHWAHEDQRDEPCKNS